MNQQAWNGAIWSGVFSAFQEITGLKESLEGPVWLAEQIDQAERALEKIKTKDVISKLAETSDYVLPAIAAALMSHRDEPLRILDFGGGLASSYLPMRAMLSDDLRMNFAIVENKEICEAGRNLFASDPQVTFLAEMPKGVRFDIVHAGSSMHYVDDWIGLLGNFAELQPDILIFADLPAGDIDTFVTSQNYYGRKIPVRFWNIAEFIQNVEKTGYKLQLKSRYRTNYLDAMKFFDESYRLNYFAQLIFKRR